MSSTNFANKFINYCKKEFSKTVSATTEKCLMAAIKEGSFSRKNILDRVEKWLMVCEEKAWSEEYDRVLNIIQMVAFTATPQMIGMLGSSYSTSGGSLSWSQGGNNPLSSMGMLNTINAADISPFDMNDFPQLPSRPSSAGGQQGQLGATRKQGVGVSSIVQQNHEFSIQNEDFPALPGYKGGSSDFSVDLHQKEQLHENISTMQSQHLPFDINQMTRSGGFSLGGTFQSNLQQQQHHATTAKSGEVPFAPGNTQDLRSHGSDFFPSSW